MCDTEQYSENLSFQNSEDKYDQLQQKNYKFVNIFNHVPNVQSSYIWICVKFPFHLKDSSLFIKLSLTHESYSYAYYSLIHRNDHLK